MSNGGERITIGDLKKYIKDLPDNSCVKFCKAYNLEDLKDAKDIYGAKFLESEKFPEDRASGTLYLAMPKRDFNYYDFWEHFSIN